MRRLDFPPRILGRIEHDRYHHPRPRVQRRMELLPLAADGLPRADLLRLTGLSRATAQRRPDDYRDGGLDAVRRRNYRGRPNGLAPHALAPEGHSRRRPPATVADARAAIERSTGVRRGPTRVRQPLKKLGLGCRKARGVPAEADPAARQQFPADTPQPPPAAAAAGRREVLFADAARFVRGGFLACLRRLVRWVVPAGSGRQRYGVLGALDAASRAVVREAADGTVTEVTAGRRPLEVRAAVPTGPITVVRDNPRYPHTALVRTVAACARIDLVYRPPYPPNPNRIERVWKFVKKAALANRTFADCPAFKAALDTTLDGLGTTHKHAIASLLTLRLETLQVASDSTA